MAPMGCSYRLSWLLCKYLMILGKVAHRTCSQQSDQAGHNCPRSMVNIHALNYWFDASCHLISAITSKWSINSIYMVALCAYWHAFHERLPTKGVLMHRVDHTSNLITLHNLKSAKMARLRKSDEQRAIATENEYRKLTPSTWIHSKCTLHPD